MSEIEQLNVIKAAKESEKNDFTFVQEETQHQVCNSAYFILSGKWKMKYFL